MIYLFDNTSSEFIKKYINPLEYTDVLYFSPSATMDMVETMTTALEAADWIFLHRSFEAEYEDEYYMIAEDIADWGKKVPLLIFSDGDMPEPVINKQTATYIQSYKKSEFYSSLPGFLSSIRANGKTDIQVLLTKSWANNPANSEMQEHPNISELGKELLVGIRALNQDDKASSYIDLEKLKLILDYSQPEIGIQTETILAEVENGVLKVGKIRELINKVIDSYNNYGKNIYTWTR